MLAGVAGRHAIVARVVLDVCSRADDFRSLLETGVAFAYDNQNDNTPASVI